MTFYFSHRKLFLVVLVNINRTFFYVQWLRGLTWLAPKISKKHIKSYISSLLKPFVSFKCILFSIQFSLLYYICLYAYAIFECA